MAISKYTIKDQMELVQAFSGGVLYGLNPAGKYDATTFKYPIVVTVDSDAKTFKVTQAGESEGVSNNTTAFVSQAAVKTPIYKKWWFWVSIVAGIAVLGGIIAAIALNV